MTIEDLRDHGVLLPEEEWGTREVETTVAQVPFGLAFLVAVAALVAIYGGGGGRITWVGVAAFLIAIYILTWLADRAVLAQRLRSRRERAELEEGP